MNRDELAARLAVHEGDKLKPYRDSVGKLTIGRGRNLDDVGLRPDETLYLCINDIKAAEDDLDHHYPWWRNMDEVRQQVLCEMAFNMGIVRLGGFQHMLGYLSQGNTSGAAEEMLASQWATQVGQRARTLAQAMKTGRF